MALNPLCYKGLRYAIFVNKFGANQTELRVYAA